MTDQRFNYALYDLITAIDAAPDRDEVAHLYKDWCLAQGAVVVHVFWGPELSDQHISTLPDWEVEATCAFAKTGGNRVARLVAEGATTVYWGTELAERITDLSDADIAIAELRRHHFNQRASVALTMPGLDGRYRGAGVGLGFDESLDKFDRRLENSGGALSMATHYAFANMLKARPARVPSPLSGRQTEILQYLATGHRPRAIAEKMGITESAVALYLGNLRKKLGAATKEQAIAMALGNGWIEL